MSKPETRAEFAARMRSIGFVGTKLRGDRATFQRDFERNTGRELDTYAQLKSEGIQPDGTYTHSLDKAKAISDSLGFAYRGDNMTAQMEKHGVVESKPFTEKERSTIRNELRKQK